MPGTNAAAIAHLLVLLKSLKFYHQSAGTVARLMTYLVEGLSSSISEKNTRAKEFFHRRGIGNYRRHVNMWNAFLQKRVAILLRYSRCINQDK
jgi:hypothetical protein